MNSICNRAVAVFVGMAMAGPLLAGPITGQEGDRQARVSEQLKKSLAEEKTDAGKFTQIARVMKDERSADFKRRILESAIQIGGPELEKFLINLADQ